MKLSIIAAIGARTRAIGKNGQLLWRIPEDLKRFKTLTMGHPIIMGRKTFESIGKVLPGRTNIVITRDKNFSFPDAVIVHSLEDATQKAEGLDPKETFIIGGGEIYAQALAHADRLYLTVVESDIEGNVFFPAYKHLFTKKTREEKRTDEKTGLSYTWLDLER